MQYFLSIKQHGFQCFVLFLLCLSTQTHCTYPMFLTGSALTVLAPAAPLAPSLTPAAQPTISLLSDTNTDSLSVDSLTLLPPADPPCLRRFSRDEATPTDPDAHTASDLKGAEDRKDISAAPEEHGTYTRENDKPDRTDSEPAKVSEPNVTSRSREKVETEISAPDPEENLDLEQETEIDWDTFCLLRNQLKPERLISVCSSQRWLSSRSVPPLCLRTFLNATFFSPHNSRVIDRIFQSTSLFLL